MTKWWMSGSDKKLLWRKWRWAGQRQAERRKNCCDTFTSVCPRTTCVRKQLQLLLLSCTSYQCSSLCSPKRKGEDKDDVVRAWDRKETNRATAPRTETVWKDQAPGWFLLEAVRKLEQGWVQVQRAAPSFAHHHLPRSIFPPARWWASRRHTTPPGGRGRRPGWLQEQAWRDLWALYSLRKRPRLRVWTGPKTADGALAKTKEGSRHALLGIFQVSIDFANIYIFACQVGKAICASQSF